MLEPLAVAAAGLSSSIVDGIRRLGRRLRHRRFCSSLRLYSFVLGPIAGLGSFFMILYFE